MLWGLPLVLWAAPTTPEAAPTTRAAPTTPQSVPDTDTVSIEESVISPPQLQSSLITNSNSSVTYHIMPGLTQKGGDLLISSDGYEYIRKYDSRRPHLVDWKCNIESCGNKCKVLYRGGIYKKNSVPHNHPPNQKLEEMRTLRMEVKQHVRANPQVSCKSVVEAVLSQMPASEERRYVVSQNALIQQGYRTKRSREGTAQKTDQPSKKLRVSTSTPSIPDAHTRRSSRIKQKTQPFHIGI